MSGENENTNAIDVDQWIKETKIGEEAGKLIKQRDVAVEELIEFDIEDLKRFAEDLKLDSLSKNRFMKSITKLQSEKNDIPNMSSMSYTPSLTTNFIAKQHVIVSPSEHNAIVKLYEKYDKCSTLSNTIHSSIHILNESEKFIINEIENNINSLIQKIKAIETNALTEINKMETDKKQTLKHQLSDTENYIKIVRDGQNKYQQYVKQSNMELKQRKKLILNMTKDILNRDGISMAMLTAPKMQFDFEKHNKLLNKLFNKIVLNDCDQPHPMKMSLYKVRDGIIEVQYSLHKDDINGPKKILQIVLEYAILNKSYSKHKPKKRYKKDTSDSNSNWSDSYDSKSDSHCDSESDISDLNINEEIDDIDINSLKWYENKGKIKYKKHKKRNKYKLDGLKENRAYLIRMRARNSSGFGSYSQIISVLTPKCEIKFDRFDKRYIAVEKKGKKVRTNNNSCTYVSVFCSKGFNAGIIKWKIKIITRKHGSTEQVGIVQNIYEGQQCYSKQISTCGGIGSGTGLKNNDIIEIILDFKKGNVTFLKNNSQLKTQNITKGVKYYPCIQTCACSGQMFEVVK